MHAPLLEVELKVTAGLGAGPGLGTAAILTVFITFAVRAPRAVLDANRSGDRFCHCCGILTGDCTACYSPSSSTTKGFSTPKPPWKLLGGKLYVWMVLFTWTDH